MRHVALWMVFSFCASCATVQRPDIHFRIVNAPGNERCGYSFRDDYDDDGRLLPGARMTCRPNHTVADLNKAMLVEADGSETGFEDGIALLKAYIRKLREEYERNKSTNKACVL